MANNPSIFGASVTFTATVAPSSATGTVQFYADGATLGSAVALSGGTASVSTAAPSVGTHVITATYSGDANHIGSSGTLAPNQVVEATLIVNIVGGGSVTRNPDQATYPLGTVVTLTAAPDPGWSFSMWSGALSGNTNPDSITVDANKVVTATFIQNEYTLMVSTVGSGSVAKNPDQSTYHYGDVVTLTATPVTGWAFSFWTSDLTGGANPVTITIDGNNVVTATFAQNQHPLTTHIVGSGSVTRAPDQASYAFGTVVTLTAVPAPGWSFSAWSGALSGNTNPESITIDGDKVVTATFTQDEYTLRVSTVGSGSVAKNPDQSTYHYGDVVTFTATPVTGWAFSFWSGGLTGSANPATITITGNKIVTATFELVAINNPPIADAGPDRTVYVNTNVTLNGSASTDPDGNLPLRFGWTQTGGPAVSFNRALSVTTFTAPSTPQVLTFTLTVTDSLGLASAPDIVVLAVRNYSIYVPLIMRNAP